MGISKYVRELYFLFLCGDDHATELDGEFLWDFEDMDIHYIPWLIKRITDDK